jgi:AraC-like DNA-binding protein
VADFVPGKAGILCDSLHPEWAGMRFFASDGPQAWTDDGQRIEGTRFQATGPTLHPIHFSMTRVRMWAFGFLPLGWARFVRLPAAEFANKICDGFNHPGCAPFVPLAQSIFKDEADEAAELGRLIAFFRNFKHRPVTDEGRILAIHAALVDPDLVSVSDLVDRVAASQRTIERLCHRHFGFSPKLLLRRQRFMRSLAQFMLDPSLNWIGAMDQNYHDQAQFVRDFREFMKISPREYAAQPHPVLDTFLRERMRTHGAAVQTLDKPSSSAARPAE